VKASSARILTGAIAIASMAVPTMAQPVQQKEITHQVAELRNTPGLANSGHFTSGILGSLLGSKNSKEIAATPYCQFSQCKDGCQHTQSCSSGGLGG
jgi:hypothetical protein